jgi:hypothetical protein
MRTPPSSPWIIRLSVSIYRLLIRGLGPTSYLRQYGDLTIGLFRESCQDAYRQRGTLGVLGLWLPSFRDAVSQMMIEVLCVRQQTSQPHISVATVLPALALEYGSAPIGIMRNFIHRLTWRLEKRIEQRSWLKHPANMHFEQGLRHWVTVAPSGVVTSDLQGRSSAFLRVSKVPNAGIPHILPQKLVGMTLRQTIKADDYRGKQLRFSGEVKAEQVEQLGGLYIRTNVLHWKRIQEEFGVEQPGDPSIQANRPDEKVRPQHLVQGTHDWMRCEATVPVAEDALFIRFGLVLYGKGQIWLRDAQLEVIEQDGMLSASL